MDIARFKKLPIMGIWRGVEDAALEPLLDTAISAGLETVEITMNTPQAAQLIKHAVRYCQRRLVVGAGTVLDMDSLKAALEAGATFIVMPVVITEVLTYCKKNKIPVFPGAFTPQEIYDAARGGATMVKVFPAALGGPKYFKQLKGPFNDIELMAVDGVREDNIAEYFAAGASAVAVGASVFDLLQISQGRFEHIRQRLAGLVAKVRAVLK
ncbi:MAG: bifunctional 4-hydroxy-2-oxoglutarate aldolase/2-dehydro-3-deoxy-phosphogluconate aldolase [Candidatus Omnitrophica bacterium]|nr:bifunctional 4-hydroxy-2-oxoglutarate aldolase/2-dehydro-3-deoxy-phosphogluconate aldolase [Candidatus Omnitrophota bacterium]